MKRPSTPETIILDSGALIQLERGHAGMISVMKLVQTGKARAVIPRTVLAEIWRGGPRQARLATLLKLAKTPRRGLISIDELTDERAQQIGRLISVCGHDDIVDVNVALCARISADDTVDAVVITADRDHILKVEPRLKDAIQDI
ncbi:hypothetical protein [Streptosporangium sp. KLBMP 9127]|nr:hypothetical protein [Streptosporangium sp. KLBMP 9127]